MIPKKTMRDVTSSLASSSFRRVQQDGRVTFARRVRTLGNIRNPVRPAGRP